MKRKCAIAWRATERTKANRTYWEKTSQKTDQKVDYVERGDRTGFKSGSQKARFDFEILLDFVMDAGTVSPLDPVFSDRPYSSGSKIILSKSS
jgi:hypothetical protein